MILDVPSQVAGPDSNVICVTSETNWVGLKVRLREIRPSDRRTLMGFDREAARSRDPHIGGYRHWAAHRRRMTGSADDFHLAIETLHSRVLVGSMWVVGDPASSWFSYGIGIGAQHRRCGHARDAATVVLAAMFGQARYRSCELTIFGGNVASLSMHADLGFREVGRPRDSDLVRGTVKYPAQMRLGADEFAARHPHLTASAGPLRSPRGRHWRTPRRGRHWVLTTSTRRA